MNSFNHTAQFPYNSCPTTLDDNDNDDSQQDDRVFQGVLEIYVHNARNIHNICIYDNQDVYAKFSLTYNPDETISTKIVKGGGKNPDFNEKLDMKVSQLDAVLKCEVWLFSSIRNLMEDQLLGFALVPISMAASVGKGKVIEEEFSLSSTDLFHSPAGTVKLRLELLLDHSVYLGSCSMSPGLSSSISSEVVLLDRNGMERGEVSDRDEYSRVEFPDINVVRENDQMVSEYLNLALARGGGGDAGIKKVNQIGQGGLFSFLHVDNMVSRELSIEDEMSTVNSSSDESSSSASPHDAGSGPSGSNSVMNSGFMSFASSVYMSDDRSALDPMEKRGAYAIPAGAAAIRDRDHHINYSTLASVLNTHSTGAPISSEVANINYGNESQSNESMRDEEHNGNKDYKSGMNSAQFPHQIVAAAPLDNINFEAEQAAAMQQQIVDMYMKSVQQFTDSMAKMKIPIDLDNKQGHDLQEIMTDHGVRDQEPHSIRDKKLLESDKKDGSRVFYGSRAFF